MASSKTCCSSLSLSSSSLKESTLVFFITLKTVKPKTPLPRFAIPNNFFFGYLLKVHIKFFYKHDLLNSVTSANSVRLLGTFYE